MAAVIALLHDADARARVAAALGGRSAVTFCETRPALLDAVARCGPEIVIVALRDARGAPATALIRALRDGFPTVAVVGHCAAVTPQAMRDAVDAAHVGMADVIIKHHCDAGSVLYATLDAAAYHALGHHAARELCGVVSAALLPLVRYAVTNAPRAPSVADVADAMGVAPRTLAHRLARAALPAPAALIGWCRLVAAARLLADPTRTVPRVAAELQFGSDAALRNMLKHYTGLRPQDVRAQGGVAAVLAALKQVAAAGRSPGRRQP